MAIFPFISFSHLDQRCPGLASLAMSTQVLASGRGQFPHIYAASSITANCEMAASRQCPPGQNPKAALDPNRLPVGKRASRLPQRRHAADWLRIAIQNVINRFLVPANDTCSNEVISEEIEQAGVTWCQCFQADLNSQR